MYTNIQIYDELVAHALGTRPFFSFVTQRNHYRRTKNPSSYKTVKINQMVFFLYWDRGLMMAQWTIIILRNAITKGKWTRVRLRECRVKCVFRLVSRCINVPKFQTRFQIKLRQFFLQPSFNHHWKTQLFEHLRFKLDCLPISILNRNATHQMVKEKHNCRSLEKKIRSNLLYWS